MTRSNLAPRNPARSLEATQVQAIVFHPGVLAAGVGGGEVGRPAGWRAFLLVVLVRAGVYLWITIWPPAMACGSAASISVDVPILLS